MNFTDYDKIERKIMTLSETTLRDIEIRAYFAGLRDSGLRYKDAICRSAGKFYTSGANIARIIGEKQ